MNTDAFFIGFCAFLLSAFAISILAEVPRVQFWCVRFIMTTSSFFLPKKVSQLSATILTVEK
jgi:hypothetical protein